MGLLDRLTSTLAGAEALPDEVREEIARALAAADQGELASADERLSALAKQHPRAVALQLALGEVRARAGDDEGAVAAFGRAVDIDKSAVHAWLGLAEALTRLGRADPARDAFRRALSLTSDPVLRGRAHAGRGRLALRIGRLAKAVRELRKASDLLPDDASVAGDLGRALRAAGEPEGQKWLLHAANDERADPSLVIEAAAAAPAAPVTEGLLQAALGRASGLTEARLRAALALHLVAQNRLDEAAAQATEALAMAPSTAEVIAAWRAVSEARGDLGEALRAAAREAELGAAPAPEALVRLAVEAGDRDSLGAALAGVPADHALAAPLERAQAGAATDSDLVTLAAFAPVEAGKRFVARVLAPDAPPRGNLFALLAFARDLAGRVPALAPLLPAAARAAEAFDRPLSVAVMGEFNAGKSSFVNALCGDEVAPVGVTPTTATINVLRHGPPGGRVLYHDGRAEDLTAPALAAFLAGLGDDAGTVRTVEIWHPLEMLQRVEIVDTPGLNSLRPEHEAVARAFLVEADAIVWLFAVGQAAKATERDALALALAAGKRVLGVINKSDQASPDELDEVRRHVLASFGDRVEALLAMSARQALRARRQGDEARLQASGLPAVLTALDERFFAHARALKRRTALAALDRFVTEARALCPPAGPIADDFATRRSTLERAHLAFTGAMAAERISLRARLEEAFRHAASELVELVRPRAWPFPERRADAADEEYLFDLLDDEIARAVEATRRALEEAAAGGPALPVAATTDRFRAYARGVLAGGLVERFLSEDLGGELPVVQRALVRRLPDLEGELFLPLATGAAAAYARARQALADEEARTQIAAVLRDERVTRPLAALAEAVAELGGD